METIPLEDRPLFKDFWHIADSDYSGEVQLEQVRFAIQVFLGESLFEFQTPTQTCFEIVAKEHGTAENVIIQEAAFRDFFVLLK